MREKKSLTRETARRYRKSRKRKKQRILDEFVESTGYNRKYAIHLLHNWGREKLLSIGGKPVRFVLGSSPAKRRGKRECLYGPEVYEAVRRIWEFFDYMCGKRLAVLIRSNIARLARSEFDIDEAVRRKLLRISPTTIDRILTPERKKLALKGRSHTKAGTLLKH